MKYKLSGMNLFVLLALLSLSACKKNSNAGSIVPQGGEREHENPVVAGNGGGVGGDNGEPIGPDPDNGGVGGDNGNPIGPDPDNGGVGGDNGNPVNPDPDIGGVGGDNGNPVNPDPDIGGVGGDNGEPVGPDPDNGGVGGDNGEPVGPDPDNGGVGGDNGEPVGPDPDNGGVGGDNGEPVDPEEGEEDVSCARFGDPIPEGTETFEIEDVCYLREIHCDGQDNDRDGIVDENLGLRDGCSFVNDEGNRVGGVPICDPGDPTQTICVEGRRSPENWCDALDNDGDGRTDEGFDIGQNCTNGNPGEEGYFAGERTCSADRLSTECMTEDLCDGLDNDSDGVIDEGFNIGERCFSRVQEDVPLYGEYRCEQDQQNSHCVLVDEIPQRAELCDNADNDEDDRVDEGYDIGERCFVPDEDEENCFYLGIRICNQDPDFDPLVTLDGQTQCMWQSREFACELVYSISETILEGFLCEPYFCDLGIIESHDGVDCNVIMNNFRRDYPEQENQFGSITLRGMDPIKLCPQ